MPAYNLHLLVPIHIRHEAETEALIVAGVRESIDGEAGPTRPEHVTHPRVQFVVVDLAPELRFFIGDAFSGG